MSFKPRFAAAMLLACALLAGVCTAQATNPSKPAAGKTATATPATTAASVPAAAPASASSTAAETPTGASESGANAAPSAESATQNPACANGPCDYQQPHITIATPAPAPAPWSLQDRIKWLSVVLLVLIAYVGVMLAVSVLRKIERQTRYAEEAAQAAADAAKAALSFAENQARAERPWILVTPGPTPGVANSFSVVASNRGRSPARIVTLADGMAILKDEVELPPEPAFKSEPRTPITSTILLPGESINIKSFSRDEVRSVCANSEQMLRVEDWEEKIFLYGKVIYAELVGAGEAVHESSWCCWYVHGRQKSGLIMAGSAQYNRHT